jgi:hypothetical protein
MTDGQWKNFPAKFCYDNLWSMCTGQQWSTAKLEGLVAPHPPTAQAAWNDGMGLLLPPAAVNVQQEEDLAADVLVALSSGQKKQMPGGSDKVGLLNLRLCLAEHRWHNCTSFCMSTAWCIKPLVYASTLHSTAKRQGWVHMCAALGHEILVHLQ